MGTVYITHEDAFIGRTDERLTVKVEKQKLLDIPLIKIDGLVVLGRATLSPALVSDLLDRALPVTYLTATGRYLGRLEPEATKNIFVRQAQWQAAGETTRSRHVVRGFVRGKLKNYRYAIYAASNKHPELELSAELDGLTETIAALESTESIDRLRGFEGAGSALYFGCFDRRLRVAEFSFNTRNRRPPKDPVNSLLSLGYALLRHHVQSALNIVGFDPYLGYLHTQRYGRPSLALDLMEEFRPLIADAIALTAINKRLLTPECFVTEPLSGAVSLTRDGLKIFLRVYEEKMQSKFKHPVLKRQFTYREALEVQARLLAKYLMGETTQYPPLILKKG